MIGGLRELGKTVLLTTHYLDEAQALADRVAIISAGVLVAQGTPSQLGGRELMATRVSFRLPDGTTRGDLPAALGGAHEPQPGLIELQTDAPVQTLKALTTWADARGADLPGLAVSRPSLEDVYLKLTEADAR